MFESYEFGPFQVQVSDRLILKQGRPLHVTSKAFDTLVVLLRQRGHLVKKEDLIRHVWGDTFIEEGNIAFTISLLRKALGDNGKEQQYIETVAKYGYRFTGPDPARNTQERKSLSPPVSGLSFRSKRTLVLEPTSKEARARIRYLEGRYFWNKRTQSDLRRSVACFLESTAEDPNCAPAFSGLADSYVLLGVFGIESALRVNSTAGISARRALELDDKLAEAHASMGMVNFICRWNWQEAEACFQRSIRLNPAYITARNWYALLLTARGRFDEAIEQILYAEELDPVSLNVKMHSGLVFYWMREYKDAAASYRKILDLDPRHERAHLRLGMCYAAQGDFEAALDQFLASRLLADGDPYLDALIGYADARMGNLAAAKNRLRKLLRQTETGLRPAFSVAMVHLGLGNEGHALEWLSKAYTDRSSYLTYSRNEPILDPIRNASGFVGLLQRMDLG